VNDNKIVFVKRNKNVVHKSWLSTLNINDASLAGIAFNKYKPGNVVILSFH
jgi:hypothetical protein